MSAFYIHITAVTQLPVLLPVLLPVGCDIDRTMMVVALRLPISGILPDRIVQSLRHQEEDRGLLKLCEPYCQPFRFLLARPSCSIDSSHSSGSLAFDRKSYAGWILSFFLWPGLLQAAVRP
jgi:hypothetical protein